MHHLYISRVYASVGQRDPLTLDEGITVWCVRAHSTGEYTVVPIFNELPYLLFMYKSF